MLDKRYQTAAALYPYERVAAQDAAHSVKQSMHFCVILTAVNRKSPRSRLPISSPNAFNS